EQPFSQPCPGKAFAAKVAVRIPLAAPVPRITAGALRLGISQPCQAAAGPLRTACGLCARGSARGARMAGFRRAALARALPAPGGSSDLVTVSRRRRPAFKIDVPGARRELRCRRGGSASQTGARRSRGPRSEPGRQARHGTWRHATEPD
ncbi:unnamed protein product, partial [Polarella glacialis]